MSRRDITQTIIDLLPADEQVSVDVAIRSWYRNIRSTGGLGLNKHGFEVMKSLELESWYFPVTDFKKAISKKILLDLDRKLQWPYYIDPRGKRIVFFGSREALMATMYGDLQKWLSSIG
jgi:hypothetical protein